MDAAEEFDAYVPYREFPTARGSTGRPVVTVEFRLGEQRFSYPMLVDSGADNIVLPNH